MFTSLVAAHEEYIIELMFEKIDANVFFVTSSGFGGDKKIDMCTMSADGQQFKFTKCEESVKKSEILTYINSIVIATDTNGDPLRVTTYDVFDRSVMTYNVFAVNDRFKKYMMVDRIMVTDDTIFAAVKFPVPIFALGEHHCIEIPIRYGNMNIGVKRNMPFCIEKMAILDDRIEFHLSNNDVNMPHIMTLLLNDGDITHIRIRDVTYRVLDSRNSVVGSKLDN